MSLSWSPKDPDEVLDYSIEWAPRVGDDTIISYLLTQTDTDSDVVIDSSSILGTLVTAWLSGGAEAKEFKAVCRVVTVGGRTMDETVTMQVKTR